MKWILLTFVLLAVLALVTVAWQTSEMKWAPAAWRGLRSPRRGRPPRARCLPCHGSGRLDRGPERTMNLRGDGFEDRRRPATRCRACGGTGFAPDR